MKKTKICYLISNIDKAVYFEQTAIHLRAENLDVSYILINSNNGALHEFLVKNGFVVHYFEVENLTKSGKAIWKCRRLLKEMSITHVHCHLAQANWIGLWAAKLGGIKNRIYTRHSGAPLVLHWKEKIIDIVQNKLASQIVSISKNIDDLLASQGVNSSKRRLIYHGFDLDRFAHPVNSEVHRIKEKYNPNNQSPVIGVIARWMKWKGIQDIIGAYKRILQDYPNALLCLFGASDNADYSNEIKLLLNEFPSENVRVVSFEQNVFDLYQLFDFYVHVPVNPTCEAFGQTYVEALAAGTPSIFTLSGIAREFVVNEENAIVVPFGDSDAIYNSLIQLIENQELCDKLAKNGINSVKVLFSFETYILNLLNLYKE